MYVDRVQDSSSARLNYHVGMERVDAPTMGVCTLIEYKTVLLPGQIIM
jgi:hypothetical protein